MLLHERDAKHRNLGKLDLVLRVMRREKEAAYNHTSCYVTSEKLLDWALVNQTESEQLREICDLLMPQKIIEQVIKSHTHDLPDREKYHLVDHVAEQAPKLIREVAMARSFDAVNLLESILVTSPELVDVMDVFKQMVKTYIKILVDNLLVVMKAGYPLDLISSVFELRIDADAFQNLYLAVYPSVYRSEG